MNDFPKENAKRRKPYMKPEVRQVPLKPLEAVLGLGCKLSGHGTGPDGPCTPGTCKNSGS